MGEYSMIHTPIGDKYCLEISLPDNYSPPRGRHTRCLNNTLTTTKKDRATFRSGVWKLISNKKTIVLGILITTRHPQTRAATQTPYNIPNLPPPPKPHRQSHPLSIGHNGQMIIKKQAPHKTMGGGLSSMPTEILEQILGYLSFQQRIGVQRINQRFRDATMTPKLWKSVIIRNRLITNTIIKNILQAQTTSLDLPSCVWRAHQTEEIDMENFLILNPPKFDLSRPPRIRRQQQLRGNTNYPFQKPSHPGFIRGRLHPVESHPGQIGQDK